jgi:hypothetical protein
MNEMTEERASELIRTKAETIVRAIALMRNHGDC